MYVICPWQMLCTACCYHKEFISTCRLPTLGSVGINPRNLLLEAWRSLRGLDRWPNPPAVLASATINHVTVMSNGLRCTLRDVFLSLLRHPETQPQRSGNALWVSALFGAWFGLLGVGFGDLTRENM